MSQDAPPVDDSPVRLPDIFGISPLRYIPVLWGVALLALLFLLLVLPGILNYGSRVRFTSVPHGAAVYMNGTYLGATPLEAFVPAGIHDFSLETPHHSAFHTTESVPGRIFASLFFPRQETLHADLIAESGEQLARNAVQEFSDWALVGGENSNYRIPTVLAPAVHRLNLMNEHDLAETVLGYSLEQITSRQQSLDFLSAAALAATPVFSPGTVVEVLKRLNAVETGSAHALLWLQQAAPVTAADYLADKSYFQDTSEQTAAAMITATNPHGFGPEGLEYMPSISPREIRAYIGSTEFTFQAVPHTEYLYGAASENGSPGGSTMPRTTSTDQFYMLRTPVTIEQWNAVAGTPLQARSTGGTSAPAAQISFDQAEHYRDTLQKRLQTQLPDGWRVAIPTTEQWEAAARWNAEPQPDAVLWSQDRTAPQAVGRSVGNIGLADMSGNVWEWTRSWYVPARGYGLDAGYNIGNNIDWPRAERIVRGASWANRRSGTTVEQVGIHPPEWRTDYLGIRLILEAR